VRAVVGLGESFGLAVEAEGVERRAQASSLMALGCSIAQGYLFGYPQPRERPRALPADDLSSWDLGAGMRTSA
jgi:EAL domain-containing protein (putative c-di-GMP-specific phosphodiesterase class I)